MNTNLTPTPQNEKPTTLRALSSFGKTAKDFLIRTAARPFWREYGYLFFCMAIPVVLVYLIYVSKGLHPFGDGCVLVLDLNAQYVWFFEALRNFVKGDADLLYSFSRALGGEFLGIYAYYIASPLSFLVCLFPKERMLEALLSLFLLKTAICGGTFGFYMHKTLKGKKPFAVVAFSILYAMSSYALVQQHNTMWIDAVMLLPLITLGIEELIKHGKFKLYTVTLSVVLISNFYIGYMVCIYCLIYFFLYYFAHDEQLRNNPLAEKLHFFKSLLRIGFYSLLAIGVGMVILLAAYYSLNFGKTTFSQTQWVWNTNFDIIDLLYKLLPGSYDTVRPEGLPFLYCGLLTVLLIPAYFLSQKYTLRQKIFSVLLIFIFVASMTMSVTDQIWHGFQRPNWLNYRYSFMLCFYLCVLACRAFSDFEAISLKFILGTGGLIALFCVMLQTYKKEPYIDPNDYTCIWFTLLALFVYLAILYGLRRAEDKQIASVVLVATISIEVFLNGLWNLNALDADVTYSTYSRYNDFLSSTRPLVENVQASDPSFYRMEKTVFRNINDNMALNMRGLTGSTSTLNKETIQFLNKMGYASASHWSKYLGGTPVNDSLLGIKYIVSKDTIYTNYYETYQTDPLNQLTAYKNPYALSIAYGVDEDILDFPLGYVNGLSDSMASGGEELDADGEEKESIIGSTIEKIKGKLNQWFDIDETVNFAEYEDAYDSPFERLNAIITAMLGEDETVQVFVPIPFADKEAGGDFRYYMAQGHDCYTVRNEDSDEEITLSFTFQMPTLSTEESEEDKRTELFFYMPSDYPREVSLTLEKNGTDYDMGKFHGGETSRIISLGMQPEQQKMVLTVSGTEIYPMMGEEVFYYIDWAVFEDAMARLAKDQYQVTEHTESSFAGTFTASREHELVMTTLAFDKGWKVLVDGNEVETVKALGSVVAFYIDGTAGQEHTVELVYRPNILYIGLTVSLLSLGILVLLIVLEKKLKNIPVIRGLVTVIPGPVSAVNESIDCTEEIEVEADTENEPNAPVGNDQTEEPPTDAP